MHALCTSDALAAEVTPEVYEYVDNTPQYGRCSYALFYENYGLGDRISWISIDLAIEEPLVADVSAVATAPDTSDQILESPNITADEQAYFAQVSPLLTTMSDSIDQFSALINDPQVGDTIWTINVVTELAVWDESYEHVSGLTPPPSLAALHSQVVEAFRLYSRLGTILFWVRIAPIWS